MNAVYGIEPVRAKLVELAGVFRTDEPHAPADYDHVIDVAVAITKSDKAVFLAGVLAGALDVLPGETRLAYGDRLLEAMG